MRKRLLKSEVALLQTFNIGLFHLVQFVNWHFFLEFKGLKACLPVESALRLSS